MLKKKQRLTKKEFDNVFAKGKRIHTPTLQLIYKESDVFCGAAVVGKKVYKKAVDRNRLRRQLYGALYRHQKQHTSTGTFILIAKPTIKSVQPSLLRKEVDEILSLV